jgi:hypothetical protein
MASGEKTNGSLAVAFEVALSLKFNLFFSFDYAGGAWDKSTVINLIDTWKGSSAYYKRGSQPLVSTFEGPSAAPDWIEIKSKTGCFFVPDYSSLVCHSLAFVADAGGATLAPLSNAISQHNNVSNINSSIRARKVLYKLDLGLLMVYSVGPLGPQVLRT